MSDDDGRDRGRIVATRGRPALALAFLSLLAACGGGPLVDGGPEASAVAPSDRIVRHHVLAVRSDGAGQLSDFNSKLDFRDCPGTYGEADWNDAGGSSDKSTARLRLRFACILNHAGAMAVRKGKPLELLFLLNGGLNKLEDVLALAEQSTDAILELGKYPIFLIWPTGGLDAWKENTLSVRQGLVQDEGDRSLWFATGKVTDDVLSGLGATPGALATSVKTFRDSGYGIESEQYSVARDEAWRLPADATPTPDRNLVFSDTVDEVDPGSAVARVGGYVKSAALSPVRVLSTPLIGAGRSMWENMVRRARNTIHAADSFPDPADALPAPEEQPGAVCATTADGAERSAACIAAERQALWRLYPHGTGGFARFFHFLARCGAEPRPKGRSAPSAGDGCPEKVGATARRELGTARISVIGHSMGSIVGNELLTAFPHLPWRSIVYMGAAASIRDTARAVSPVLIERKGAARFYSLMLHPMNEAREETARGTVVSGSLLTYIDEFLERPKTVPDRTLGQYRNLRLAKHVFPREAQRWMLFRVFDREPPAGQPMPTTHGAFNDFDKGIHFFEEPFWTGRPPRAATTAKAGSGRAGAARGG